MDNIEIGNIVKCIDNHFEDSDTNPFRESNMILPEKDEIYTVREVVGTSYGKGILLKEIHNKKYFFENISENREPIFEISRFVSYSK
jgi:hypothetical protein